MSPQATEQPWTPAPVVKAAPGSARDLAHGAPTARLLLPADAPEDAWHAVRRRTIGGSKVAKILGLSKYGGPRHVYEEMHGRPLPVDAALSEYAEIGQEIEDFVSYLFTKRSGVPAVPTPGTLVHVEHEWMTANVDRYALDAETGEVVAPVELKNRSEYQLADWEDGVPDEPALQAHWYMAVGGWQYAWVAALVGGNKLRFHRLERDDELIGMLIDTCGRWFQRHILEGFPPPADGLEATKELLGRLWEVKEGEVVEVSRDRAEKLRKRRAAVIAQQKELEHERNTVENEMRLINQAAEVAKVGKSVAWTNKQNGNFAEKRFREENPEVAAQFMKSVEVVDVDRLKTERPALYAKYRARVLRVPAKEL